MIFTTTICRKHQVVERVFGMISRWRILVPPLHLNTMEMREMSSKFAICCTTFVYATDYPKKLWSIKLIKTGIHFVQIVRKWCCPKSETARGLVENTGWHVGRKGKGRRKIDKKMWIPKTGSNIYNFV